MLLNLLFFASTSGLDEAMIQTWIQAQEEHETKEERMNLEIWHRNSWQARRPLTRGFLKLPAAIGVVRDRL